MLFSSRHLRVGKVLADEGDRVILEVGKDTDVTYRVGEGTHFLTLLFVEADGDKAGLAVWDPFAEGHDYSPKGLQ